MCLVGGIAFSLISHLTSKFLFNTFSCSASIVFFFKFEWRALKYKQKKEIKRKWIRSQISMNFSGCWESTL
jgi:hypothetical protein